MKFQNTLFALQIVDFKLHSNEKKPDQSNDIISLCKLGRLSMKRLLDRTPPEFVVRQLRA